MKKNVLYIIIIILIGLVAFGGKMYSDLTKDLEKLTEKQNNNERLLDIYDDILSNFDKDFELPDSLIAKKGQDELFDKHLENIENFLYKISQNDEEEESLDYRILYLRSKSELSQAQDSLENIKSASQEEIEKYENMTDSLENVKKMLLQDISEKNKDISSNIKSIDSLKSILNKLEVDKKEVIIFKSPTGVEITYFGKVKNGKAHGHGVGSYANGNRYTGEWRNGQKHGEGVYEYPDGEQYIGSFDSDKRSGFGIYKWPSGDEYKGYWKNDKRHGEGLIHDKSGKTLSSGLWVNDALEKSQEVSF